MIMRVLRIETLYIYNHENKQIEELYIPNLKNK